MTAGVEVLVTGSGRPVTVVAHGLGASVAETRPLLGGVPGTRVFYAARGHGGTVLPVVDVDYAMLGRDLGALADEREATQVLGVSMGAGATVSLLAEHPDRFAKVVLFLPAALDQQRTDAAVGRVHRLATAIESGDLTAVRDLATAELPEDVAGSPTGAAYVDQRARFLIASPGVAALVRRLVEDRPVVDRSRLAAVSADVLLLAQEDDPLHPSQVARDLAAVLPRARLVVFDRAGVVFRERARLRALIVDFLRDA